MSPCDRCGITTREKWTCEHDAAFLQLCDHCFTRHRDALVARGWTVVLQPSKEVKA